MRKSSALFLSLFLAATLGAACSTHRTTTDEVAYDQRTGQPVTWKDIPLQLAKAPRKTPAF